MLNPRVDGPLGAWDGSASASDLAEPFDVSLMAISKHLRLMEDAGLIRRQKDDRVRRCSYDPSALGAVRDWIDIHRQYWEKQLVTHEGFPAAEADAGHASGHTKGWNACLARFEALFAD